ncbi:putative RNA-directed DNA polymerase from transposon X-element [Trichonephila clavipes]|nr:putative RNA-directed DNA polymerase from transposon X-element [Trichonephila clavipes]
MRSTSIDFLEVLSHNKDTSAVAVRIHSTSLITVCCLYLPPNTVIHQHDLNNLVDQLPAPFIILGDFNGHSTLWGSAKTNPRGRQIEQVISDLCLCLLNHEEPTFFHEPTRSFHTLDLAICSPSLLPHLNLSVEKDLYNSDHFPVILSHDSDTDGKTFPPTYSYRRADWALFTQLAVITDTMVKVESVDTCVQKVTNVLITAAELSIPKSSSHSFQHYKLWWNTDCQTAYKNQRKLWGIFRRYPTTENLLAFKKAKVKARRVRRQSQRQSWIRYVSSLTSSTSSKQLWKKVKAANGIYREFSFPVLQTSNSVFSSPEEIANILGETFQSVSSAASYNSRFLEIKRRAERTPINFSTRSFFPYNCNFTMTELKKALIQAHNTSPRPDGITKTMLRHLHPNSLANILLLFNRVWKEHCFLSSWREAIVIPILKPGKVATYPLSYRPIALTSCFCKTFERMGKRKLHPDPFIHIGNIQIPVVSEVRFLGVIFDSKLTFLLHVLYLRKKCERSLNILRVLSNTIWGADRVSLLRVYQALILSRLDYGCVVYGSARASVLKRLDTVHHSALRICSLGPSELRLLPAYMWYAINHL